MSRASLFLAAAVGLIAGAMPGVSILPERTIPLARRERNDRPRKKTQADLDRLALAEAKRARKAAKRVQA